MSPHHSVGQMTVNLSPTQTARVFSLDSGALLVVRLDGSTQVVQPMPRLVGDRATNLLRVVRDWADDIERACQPGAPAHVPTPATPDSARVRVTGMGAGFITHDSCTLGDFFAANKTIGSGNLCSDEISECRQSLADSGSWMTMRRGRTAVRVELAEPVMPKLTDSVRLAPVGAASEYVVLTLGEFYLGYAEFGIDRDACQGSLAGTGSWILCPNDAAAIRVELVR